jgi:hypothetical protein
MKIIEVAVLVLLNPVVAFVFTSLPVCHHNYY